MDNDDRQNLPSASMFERRVFCPDSHFAEMSAVMSLPPEQSDIATQGEVIHTAIATDDLSACGLTEQKVASHLSLMNDQAAAKWCQENNFTGISKVVREERFWIESRATKQRIASAKPDFVAIEKGQALIIDAKSGFKRVTEAAGNWQLKCQLIAIDQAFGPLERARVAIAQHRLGSVFDECDYTRDDIDQAYVEIEFYCRRATQPGMERVPGEHCRYCTAKGVCEVYAGYSMLPMIRAKSVSILKKKEIYARVHELPPEALAFIESRRTAATNLFEAVKERLKSLQPEQLAPLGLQLVPGGFSRDIPNLKILWEILSNNNLCTAEEFRQMCDINFGRMEELLVNRIKLRDQCTAEQAETLLDGLLEPVIIKTEKAKRLQSLKQFP